MGSIRFIVPASLRRRAAEEAEKDAATVATLRRDLIEAQKERIAELEAENAALRAVIMSGNALMYYRSGHDVVIDDSLFDPFEDALDSLYAAGYLPADEEVRP